MYRDPATLTAQSIAQLRQERVEEEELRRQLREEYLYENPRASEEKVQANVFSRLQDRKLKIRQIEKSKQDQAELEKLQQTDSYRRKHKTVPELPVPKPPKRRVVKHYSHNGVWQHSEIEGCFAWSCCMNRTQESAGCVVTKRDLDRWQLISIT